MNKVGIKPSDVLADAENFVELNGVTIRKGSIAAFLKNIDLLEAVNSSDEQKEAAVEMLQELAPAIIASALPRHAEFKNKVVQEILDKAIIA